MTVELYPFHGCEALVKNNLQLGEGKRGTKQWYGIDDIKIEFTIILSLSYP